MTSPGSMNISGGGGFPSFSFDFGAEQANAYNQLKPFYEQLLNFAGGDLDLAKRIINYTYQQGMRESTGQYQEEQKGFGLTFPRETSQQQTEQNRRGILSSGFAQTERQRLQASQDLRKEASERALSERESRLGAEKGFGTEEKLRGYQKEAFDYEGERRKEASGMASDKFTIKQAEYQGNLAKAQREEERRIAEENRKAMEAMYSKPQEVIYRYEGSPQ